MPDDELLVELLECQNNTRVGHITLNSPETLNSLTLNMVNKISMLLDEWEADPSVKMVIFSGTGEKAFCAGGDIRALYESMCSSEGPVFAEKFFESEYRLDYKMHKFSKPIVSILDGIVMGGGAGLMFGSSYRISTERTRFAMPEIGVGLFPDVGFTSVIKALPDGLGLYMMLTATQLSAKDTIFCNLTDASIKSEDINYLLSEITENIWLDEFQENIDLIGYLVKQNFYADKVKDLPDSKIEKELDEIQALTNEQELEKVCSNILSNHNDDDWYVRGRNSLKKGSPSSAHLIWHQCLNSAKLDLKEVFKFELNLAIQVTRIGDFKEGIRALIIDKDNSPKWRYDSIESVPIDWIKKHTDPAWQQNPLEDL